MEKFKEIAFEIGIGIDEYFALTPSEIGIRVDVYNRTQQQRYDEVVTVAYLSAYYNRVKKMPKLSELLSKKEQRKKEPDPAALIDKLKVLNAQLGGDVY